MLAAGERARAISMDDEARARTLCFPPKARPVYPDRASVSHFLGRLTGRAQGSATAAEAQDDPPRIDRILAALDGTPGSRHVAAWAVDLASAHGASVILAHVRYAPPFVPPSWRSAKDPTGAGSVPSFLRQAEGVLRRARIPCALAIVEGTPGPALTKLAADARADLVVVGTRPRSAAGRFVMGSSTEHLRLHARASLLIAKGSPRLDRVVLPIDGSGGSTSAALLGIEIARRAGAHVHIVRARAHDPGPDETIRYRLPWLDPPGVAEARAGDPSRVVLRATRVGRNPLLLMPAQAASAPRHERITPATWHTTPASVLLTRSRRATT